MREIQIVPTFRMEEEIVSLKMKIVKNIIYVYRIVNAIIAGKNALKRLITIKKGKERQKIAETRGKIFMDIGIYIYIFDLMIVFMKINYDRATIGKCSIVKNLGYPTQLSVKFLSRERNLRMLKFYS